MSRLLSFVLFGLFSAATAFSQTPGCEVPDKMSKDQKIPCVKSARMMIDQPTLTPTQLANGPDFDAADPEKSRFLYFTETDNIFCYFRPHYAFMSIKGESMKFQCWHMSPDGAFYAPKGEIIHLDGAKVVIDKNKDGEKSASLFRG